MQLECNWIVTWHSHNGWVKCKWNANLINIKAAQNTPFCMTQQYTIRGVMEDPPKPLKLPSPWCDSTAIRIQLENMETALGKTPSVFNPLNQQALIILQVIRCYHQGPEMTLLFLPFKWSSLITILVNHGKQLIESISASMHHKDLWFVNDVLMRKQNKVVRCGVSPGLSQRRDRNTQSV